MLLLCYCVVVVVLCVVLWCCGVVVLWSVATFESVMLTPAACPRWFEFLTTVTFRALGRHHTVSKALETITKKHSDKARCPHAISNLSRIVKAITEVGREVRPSMRWLLCREKKKRDLTSMTGSKKRYL